MVFYLLWPVWPPRLGHWLASSSTLARDTAEGGSAKDFDDQFAVGEDLGDIKENPMDPRDYPRNHRDYVS